MNNQILIKTLGAMFLGALLTVGGTLVKGSGLPETHLVMITVDGLRADAISQSAGAAKTPNIDALAKDGVVFPSAFGHAPTSLPSQTALFSSRHPTESGVTNDGHLVDPALPLLAEHLRVRGYRTRAAVSFQDTQPTQTLQGLRRGFEQFNASDDTGRSAAEVNAALLGMMKTLDPSQAFFVYAHYEDPTAPYDAHGMGEGVAEVELDGESVASLSTSDSSHWLRNEHVAPGKHTLVIESETPFILRSFHCRGPNFDLPTEYKEGALDEEVTRVEIVVDNEESKPQSCLFELRVHDAPSLAEIRERYKREVEAVDQAIGELIGQLRRQGAYEKSLIVVTSSHGEALGDHEHVGHDINVYDEMLRVPLIMKLPRGHDQRITLDENRASIARHIDVAPTVLELLEMPPIAGAVGSTLTEARRRVVRAEAHRPQAPVAMFAMRDDQFKMVYEPENESFRLYDLAQDPSELDDAFAVKGYLRARWQQELQAVARGLTSSEPISAGMSVPDN